MRNIELPADRLLDFATELLCSQGVPSTGARTVAWELREADLWDQAGHGFHRLPYYLVELEQGNIKSRGRLRREIDSGLFLRVASNNFGQVAASQAVDLACQRAEAKGACLMGWRRFHHIGRAGSWVWKAGLRGHPAGQHRGDTSRATVRRCLARIRHQPRRLRAARRAAPGDDRFLGDRHGRRQDSPA